MIDCGGAHLLRLTPSMFIAIVGTDPQFYLSFLSKDWGIEPHMLAIETGNKANQATKVRGTVSLLTIWIPLVPYHFPSTGTGIVLFNGYRYATLTISLLCFHHAICLWWGVQILWPLLGLNSYQPTQVVRRGKLDPRSDRPYSRSKWPANSIAITLLLYKETIKMLLFL